MKVLRFVARVEIAWLRLPYESLSLNPEAWLSVIFRVQPIS